MISCVLLAAGQSSRFGSDKLDHRLRSGETIFETSLSRYLPVCSEVIVVVQPEDQDRKHSLQEKSVTVVDSPNFEEGMSQSLIAGVSASPDASGWIIALADMPYIQTETLESLIAQTRPNNIVQPSHEGALGNPVVFSQIFKGELLSLEGDQGAKSVIQRNQSRLCVVPTEDKGVLQDVDRLEDVLL